MLSRTMHHVHGASPPNKNNLVIEVNVDFWTMDHVSPPNISKLVMEVNVVEHGFHLMTPQGVHERGFTIR